jgi:glycosyltransferase involved in cell wall biosynthesis
MELSVILPTHNPDPDRFRRALHGLRAQTLPITRWETVVVNNASSRFPDPDFIAAHGPANLVTTSEPQLGLSAARRRGFNSARGDVAVLVDDDNVLVPHYLATVLELFSAHPAVGVAGGKSLPEFEREPAAWEREFLPLLALRDLGPEVKISQGLRAAGQSRNAYPHYAPIGAGMALRRAAWTEWLKAVPDGDALNDRRGTELSSAGDNEIVLCAMRAGWEAAYFPSLSLIHLIPATRLDAGYLARLNRGIQQSWMQVLTRYDANPWPPLTSLGAGLRKAKAWVTHAAWRSPAAHIRWQGACGHFDGRVQP